MMFWRQLGLSDAAAGVLAVLVAVFGLGAWLVQQGSQQEPVAILDQPSVQPAVKSEEQAEPTKVEEPVVVAQPEVDGVEEAVGEDVAEAEEPPVPVAPVITAPKLDLVRVSPDGDAVVAGTADPGANVVFLVNGVEVTRATADGSGSFVGLFDIPVSDSPNAITVATETEDGALISDESVLVAAIKAPVVEDPVIVEALPPVVKEPVVAEVPEIEAPEVVEEDVVVAETVTPEVILETEVPPALEEVISNVEETDLVVADASPEQDAEPEVLTATESPDAQDTLLEIAEVSEPVVVEPSEPLVDTLPSVEEPQVDEPAVGELKVAELTEVADAEATDEVIAEVETEDPVITEPVVVAPEVKIDTTPVVVQDDAPAIASNTVDPVESAPAISEAIATKDKAAREAPTIVVASSEGVKVLQPAQQPSAPTVVAAANVVIDTISYDTEGEVALVGRGRGDGFVRVYLNDKPILTVPVEPDGSWETPLADVEAGVYRLRIDEISPQGDVTSRVETPFQREVAELAADAPPTAVTVQTGSTLWAIAKDRFGSGVDYVRVYEANRDLIRDPDLIYPGQVFALPTE